ncbi:MAG: aminoglycoside 6-adenylyltransferase [Aggregatilineales bacterium]
MDKERFYQQVETQMVAFANEQPDMRAVMIVGATERIAHPADEWSDLDIEIFTDDVEQYMDDTLWIRQFGAIWICLTVVDRDPQRLMVLFEGGHKVDFAFSPVTALQAHIDAQTLSVTQRGGYRVLLDKDNLTKKLPAIADVIDKYTPPDREEFHENVQTFWYSTVYVARQIRRRNLWVVKYRDRALKEALLEMLVWHANTRRVQIQTWHDGHFMAEWLDADTYTEVQTLFAAFDAKASWKALLTSMQLFRRTARETAQALDYLYPVTMDDNITGLITRLYTEDPEISAD